MSARSVRASVRLALEALEQRTLLSFLPRVTYPLRATPFSLTAADLDGDTGIDLVAGHTYSLSSPAGISLLLGNGDGSYQDGLDLLQNQVRPAVMAAGDFNGDGMTDLLAAGSPQARRFPEVNVLLNDGKDILHLHATYSLPSSYELLSAVALHVADFNGDGLLDFAATTSQAPIDSVSYLFSFLGNGDGTFVRNLYSRDIPARTNSATSGDFNNDGNLDVIMAGRGVYLFAGEGTGRFGHGVPVGEGYSAASASADLNGDGNLDLVLDDSISSTLRLLYGNGDGSFWEEKPLPVTGSLRSVAVADLNSDAVLDLVLLDETRSPSFLGYVSVVLGNGDGSFGNALRVSSGLGPRAMIVEDLNGDGWIDVAVANSRSAYNVAILLNDGEWGTGPGPGGGQDDGAFLADVATLLLSISRRSPSGG